MYRKKRRAQIRNYILPAVILATVIIAGTTAWWWVSRAPSISDSIAAIEKSEAAFSRIKVRGDIGFFLYQAARSAGRKLTISLDDLILENREAGLVRYDYAFWTARYRSLPAVQPFDVRIEGHGFDPGYLDAPHDPIEGARFARGMRVITDAFDCESGSPPLDTGAPPEYGYVVTHQLLALLIAAERRCVSTETLNRDAPAYVRRIYSEMMSYRAPISDIQVERAAMLSLIGRIDLVPDSMVRELVESQRPDGFWYFKGSGEETLNVIAHNSALSYMVVLAWLVENNAFNN